MKNKDLFALLNGIEKVKKLDGVKFAYAIAKNNKIIQKEISALQAGLEHKSYDEYEKKRLAICEDLCSRDKEGKPIVKNNEFVFENKKDAVKKIEKLQEEYKQAIEEKKRQIDEYNKLLEEECDIKLYKIKKECLPEKITAEQIIGISDLIEDDGRE